MKTPKKFYFVSTTFVPKADGEVYEEVWKRRNKDGTITLRVRHLGHRSYETISG